MNRRRFLQISLGTAGLVLGVDHCTLGDETTSGATWALLADTHIPTAEAGPPAGHPHFGPHANLRKAVSQIARCKPVGAVFAGDLARLEGLQGDYEQLKAITAGLGKSVPAFYAMGNHDDRGVFHNVFDGLPGRRANVPGKFVTIVEADGVRLVLLDSLFFVNKVPGLLGKAQRDWLARYLNECDERPTLMCLHHTLGDDDGDLLDVDRMFRILTGIRKVKGVIYGHSHRYGFSRYEDLHLINLPATGYSFDNNMPVGWVQAELDANGGAFTLRVLGGPMDLDGQTTRLTWRT